ncbi:hypothetical protein HC251_00580 [Iamia sp. SCSIO 61187]|uniref:hypothetical protein n=1 Tax=Iamia sp. SCSIO 61187 TaxID=2722752 RepID=UPI001C6381ED|nr:hypothetical protein [Iamia sp. SCSIO 61187]QYG91075.1 hypothetical protein HC251_00580 [Iamia sp. SCSIO 61187]
MNLNSTNPDDLVELRLVVLAKHAPGVQATVQRYLDSIDATAPTGSYTPPFGSSDGPKDAWDLPDWEDTDDDVAAMHWLVNDLSDNQLDVLHGVVSEPGSPTNLLVANAGYPEGTTASPVFRAIGSRFRRVGRRPLWIGGDKTADGQALGVTSNPIAVRLFRDAVTARADRTVSAATSTPGDAVDTWRQVLEVVELTGHDRNLLKAFRAFPNNSATAGMLAEHLGFDAHGGANLAMGRLGRRLADGLAIVDPDYATSTRPDGSTMWWHVVATGEVREDNLFWWTLRPELDAAAAAV